MALKKKGELPPWLQGAAKKKLAMNKKKVKGKKAPAPVGFGGNPFTKKLAKK